MHKKIWDSAELRQVLGEILEEIHTLSDCQSVGIRLYNNGDCPYYVHGGFPNFFILKENSLCATDEEGNPILDHDGNYLLECMCGNVLKGRSDPNLPYFTEKGSFWTNSTTQLLDTTTEKDRQGRTRNMCHHSGYESVALIPLRASDRTLGLIQMNDPRENMFTAKTIKNYEALADDIGGVISSALELQERIVGLSDLVKKLKSTKD